MNQSISKILIETVIKDSLVAIKDNSERGIRNLVDIALQFSSGRFQQKLFSAIQRMLKNENSAYYELVRNVITYSNTENLFTFGMNLGYNGCTIGAKRIRENEKIMNCNIPWVLTLQIDEKCSNNKLTRYHEVIQEGENLGIYVWMLFFVKHPERALAFAKNHPDSAFCIFCKPRDITTEFLDELSQLNNIMLVVRYEENLLEIYDTLHRMGILYSAWCQYDEMDIENIINGDLFETIQQIKPIFTILIPKETCPITIQNQIIEIVKETREKQMYCTIPLELHGDSDRIDTIISEDACSIHFDKNGDLYTYYLKIECDHHNLFEDSLSEIFKSGCPKKLPLKNNDSK